MKYDVLVLDDDPNIRYYLSAFFEMDGHSCLSAENGSQALEFLSDIEPQNRPRLAIVDVMMPVMDGPQFIVKLQERMLAPEMEIYLFTASHLHHDLEFNGRKVPVLSKPSDTNRILSLMDKAKL